MKFWIASSAVFLLTVLLDAIVLSVAIRKGTHDFLLQGATKALQYGEDYINEKLMKQHRRDGYDILVMLITALGSLTSTVFVGVSLATRFHFSSRSSTTVVVNGTPFAPKALILICACGAIFFALGMLCLYFAPSLAYAFSKQGRES
ncbi:MAG: hypothetical protein FWF45_05915 [Coriobacteriia bacterium]|nr:hypothetical protein [Coriobacteriia bacterium]